VSAIRDPFASAPAATTRSVSAPSWPAWSGLALATAATVLLIWADSFIIGIAGYMIACLLAPAMVVVFRALERQARRSLTYVHQRKLARVAVAGLVLALLAGAVHAWFIATEIAKR
jgi:hypothetical protein